MKFKFFGNGLSFGTVCRRTSDGRTNDPILALKKNSSTAVKWSSKNLATQIYNFFYKNLRRS